MFPPVNYQLPAIRCGTTWDPDALIIMQDGEPKDLTSCECKLVISDGVNIIKTLTDGDGLAVAYAAVAPIQTADETLDYNTTATYSWVLYITESDGVTIYPYALGTLDVISCPTETASLVRATVDVAYAIHNAATKTTPADNDQFGFVDSAASWVMKKLSWANIKAELKDYFDDIYSAVAGSLPTGGASGQILKKNSGTDFDMGWADPYSHPTGDGNLHVPATSTTNSGKVLTAGATAGSLSWTTPSSIYVNVKDYGAKGDASTDDTAAIQAALDTGRTVYFPRGLYVISDGLTMSGGGIIGAGLSETFLYFSQNPSSAEYAITFTGMGAIPKYGGATCVFRDFTMQGGAHNNLSGIGIVPANAVTYKGAYSSGTTYAVGDSVSYGGGTWYATTSNTGVTPALGEHWNVVETKGAVFDNICVSDFYYNIKFEQASTFSISNCQILNAIGSGVYVENTGCVDSGDSNISGCHINSSRGGDGVTQLSSGGLRLVNNKFNGGGVGYKLALSSGAYTSIIIFTGNSVENFTTAGIACYRQGTGGAYYITITGNEIARNARGVYFDSSCGASITNIVIDSNNIAVGSETITGVNCIEMEGGTVFSIVGNVLDGQANTSDCGIYVASGASYGKIGKNTYRNLSALVTNNSSTTNIEYDVQHGTWSATTSTGYGTGFYSGGAYVNYPIEFQQVAAIVANANAASSSGVIGTSAVLDTTARGYVSAFGLTNGGSVSGNYIVYGLI